MRLGARAVASLSMVGRRTGGPRTLPVIPVEIGRNHDHGESTARQLKVKPSRIPRALGWVDERPWVLGH